MKMLSSSDPTKLSTSTILQFNGTNYKQWSDAIKAFLADSGKSDPSNAEISLSVMSATLYCKTAGSDADPISKIDGN